MKSTCTKSLLLLFCLSGLLLTASCGEEETASSHHLHGLDLEQNSISVRLAANTSMDIVNGNGNYSVSSSNSEIATATIVDDRVIINGLHLGDAVITVRDKANNKATLDVTVVEIKK